MKIAQVISTGPFAWSTGGPARVVYGLSKELVRRGHKVTVLTTDMYEKKQRWVSNTNVEYVEGVRIFRFKYLCDCLAWKHKIIISPGLISYLKNHLSEYDVVHLQDLISLQAITTSNYCIKNDIPYIITAHGSIPWLNENGLSNWLYKKIWGSKILLNASLATAFTMTEIEQYKSMGVRSENIIHIPNGIDCSEFDNLPSKGAFRRKYQIAEKSKVILFLGRIERTKGLDILVKAFADLSKEPGNVLLVVVGPDDGYLSIIRKLVAKEGLESRVIFTGPLYDNDKLEAYVDADVHVLPRAREPFGLTLLEACACGTPVILSKGCGIAHALDGRAGIAIDYNKDKLKDVLLYILTDDEIRQDFSNTGKLLVREYFDWPEIAKDVEKAYLSIKR